MCSNEEMRISWWLGRLRRSSPLIVATIIVFALYSKYGSSNTPPTSRRRISTADPTLPPPVLLTERPSSNIWSKWLILFSEEDACNQISMKFPGWTVMIIGAHKVDGYRFEHCVYIGEDELYVWRNSQGFQLVDSLHVRVLAHLYAIQHGAEYLYLPPEYSSLADLGSPTIFAQEEYTGLVYKPEAPFIPGDHFGCRIRHTNGNKKHEPLYSLCTHRAPAIQIQTVVTVLRSSNSEGTLEQKHSSRIPDCDALAPPVTLPSDSFVSFEPGGTLYKKEAFWALPFMFENDELPYHKTFLWSLVVQKILWLSGNRLMVYSANSTLEHKPSFPISEKVKLTLEEWHCDKSSLFMCIMEMIKILLEKQLVDASIGPVLHEWLNALKQINYLEPAVGSEVVQTCQSKDIVFHPVDYEKSVFRRSRGRKPYIPVNNVQELYSTYLNTCSGKKDSIFNVKINFTHPWTQFEDVLLVITYNNPHYETIKYVETLYRPFFPRILHCGPGVPNINKQKLGGLKNFAFSFYSYDGTKQGHLNGSFNYECIIGAINMHLPVEGYLVISDDMLISTYKTFDLRRYLAWYLPKEEIKTADLKRLKECRLGMCDFYPHWHWWEDYQAQVISLFNRMEKEQYNSVLVNRCYRQLMLLNGGQFRANGAYSDIYYIPSRIATEFATLGTLFLEEDIFLEIAIPTILRCLENTEDIEVLRGIASWELQRDSAWTNFNKEKFLGKSYLHPTKWSYLASGQLEFKQFFCDKVLPYLHDNFGRLSTSDL